MPTLAIVNVALFAGLLGVLYQFGQRENWTLSRRVLLGISCFFLDISLFFLNISFFVLDISFSFLNVPS